MNNKELIEGIFHNFGSPYEKGLEAELMKRHMMSLGALDKDILELRKNVSDLEKSISTYSRRLITITIFMTISTFFVVVLTFVMVSYLRQG